MIKIRLQRKGRIRRPIYHIVVADSRSPRDGRIIEQVGRYDGVTEKKETIINEERISYWLDQGAKPTDAVQKILRHQGFLYKRHLKSLSLYLEYFFFLILLNSILVKHFYFHVQCRMG